MELKITTTQILKVLYILSWIIFIGVCIEAGGIIFNTFFSLVLNPIGANNFWQGVNLSSLYHYDSGHFLAITSYMSITAVMKAIIFYLIVKVLHDKKLNMVQPFNDAVRRFISNVSYLSLGIGLFSRAGVKYAEWMVNNGVEMPDVEDLRLGGAEVWLLMGVTLFVIAQIFKRGIEIQDEHELTV